MTAAVLPLTSDRPSRLPGTPTIRAELDAANLTLEAYRLYCHLACHARPTFLEGAIHWAVCRSLNRIAAECFRGSYPSTTEEVLRRKAGDAISELVDRQMIVRQKHQPGVTLANLYLLLPMEHWQMPTMSFKNPNIRKGRGRRTTVTDPPRITLNTPTDLPTIALDHSQKVTSDTLLEVPNTLDRSSQDQDLYIVYRDIYTSSKEREREKAENTFFSRNKQPEQEQNSFAAIDASFRIVENAQADKKLTDQPQTQEQDTKGSAAVGALEKSDFTKFAASDYDWTRYDRAGDGGSHPQFWKYVLQRTQNYSDRNVQAGKKPIFNLIEYALARIRNEGERLYQEFEIEQGWREAPPKPAKPQPQPIKKASVSQPADPVAQWQKISDNLNLRPPDMLLQALEQELKHISPNTTAKDAVERMQWLLKANPQWGYVLKDGKISSLIPLAEEQADLTDLLLELKWQFQQLGFDRDRRSQWLQEHYGTTLQAMSSQQLTDCLADLEEFSIKDKS